MYAENARFDAIEPIRNAAVARDWIMIVATMVGQDTGQHKQIYHGQLSLLKDRLGIVLSTARLSENRPHAEWKTESLLLG